MTVVPLVTPVTKPEVEFTVATPVLTLLHTPPLAASLSAVVTRPHIDGVPVMVPALGKGFTVNTFVAAAVPQLLVTVYEIVVVPVDTGVTNPDVELTVATPVLTLLQVPLPAASASSEVAGGQTFSVPVIVPALGAGFTVTVLVAVREPTV